MAAGEALGRPLNGLSRQEIAGRYGRVRDYLASPEPEPGPLTSQALTIAENISATGGKVVNFGLNSRDENLAGLVTPIGLLHSYGQFQRERFLQDCETGTQITDGTASDLQGGIVIAIAARLLARQEILPEDLMSAALDYLPFGLLEGYPLRVKLLAAQDYLEERQTLVDNVLAGDLQVDVFRVDLNNMERCSAGGELAGIVGAAFYAVTAYKESLEEAVTLALNTGGATGPLAALTGALAGAFHGVEAMPQRWLDGLANYEKIRETAQRLHRVARSRELTDYVNTGI